VEGDLVRVLEEAYGSMSRAPAARRWYSRLISKWMDLWQSNSLDGSRRNVQHHYDVGNDFYKLWLDPQMIYTCAYFPSRSATLEEAQTAKMEYVCRKLRLQPGETVVEAGCGWGALALHMARQYGVSVKAFNVSREQILLARERAREEGLQHQVQFIEDDYRNISGRFDAFVSVGMLEHLGTDHYRDLGKIIHRSIGDAGRGFLHFIGRNYPASFNRWIRKRIFPGAHIPTLRQAMEIFEPWNFSIVDVENLRLHYAKTLEHWLDRFEKSEQQVAAMYDSRFFRIWRLYLAGSAAAFRCGSLQLYQIVFTGSRCRPISWTRAPLYADAEPAIEKTPWIAAMS
jgi:cyclopropane-fatty-acyl-phospholipid synthase